MHDPMPQPRYTKRREADQFLADTFRYYYRIRIGALVASGTLGAAIGGLLTWLVMS
jgi:hypothetical protein